MTESASDSVARLRLDKWLWYARFFKTRSLAARACAAGRMRINREVVAKSGTSFGPGMAIMSRPQREAMYAIYAFCRDVDDTADDVTIGEDVRLDKLQLWRDEIDALVTGLDRVQSLETLFRERLARLESLPVVDEVRGIGGLAVAELQPEKQSGYLDARGPRMAQAFLQRGILLRPLGNVLYFLPPYAITDEQAHGVFDEIEEVLSHE